MKFIANMKFPFGSVDVFSFTETDERITSLNDMPDATLRVVNDLGKRVNLYVKFKVDQGFEPHRYDTATATALCEGAFNDLVEAPQLLQELARLEGRAGVKVTRFDLIIPRESVGRGEKERPSAGKTAWEQAEFIATRAKRQLQVRMNTPYYAGDDSKLERLFISFELPGAMRVRISNRAMTGLDCVTWGDVVLFGQNLQFAADSPVFGSGTFRFVEPHALIDGVKELIENCEILQSEAGWRGGLSVFKFEYDDTVYGFREVNFQK